MADIDTIDFSVLNTLATYCSDAATKSGFWDDAKQHPSIESMRSYDQSKMLLVISEITEAQDELRDGHANTETYYNVEKPGKPEGVPSEMADALIRILDYMGKKKIDVADIVEKKIRYNATRERLHGRKF